MLCICTLLLCIAGVPDTWLWVVSQMFLDVLDCFLVVVASSEGDGPRCTRHQA